jgi:hypothetical protein
VSNVSNSAFFVDKINRFNHQSMNKSLLLDYTNIIVNLFMHLLINPDQDFSEVL